MFALGAAFFPRLGVLFLWLFTPLVSRAFDTIIVPILGIIFLPFTTLVYVLVWHPVVGVTGWGWVWVILAFLFDLGAYAGSGFGNRRRLGY
ncbi:MAG: hypothetical protein GTO63_14540 [Anaerolineae bacterium]|nr:hypothetical protein [Anaerolineae bacterium]NIN96069.1 hypothetical protein [Anaerolineae bacterium]NIQ79099.1 hypothetical protein [Anaerolineae bacterium]